MLQRITLPTLLVSFLVLSFASCKKVQGTATPNVTINVISNTVVSTAAGTGSAGSANGQGADATFNEPLGVCIDNEGSVCIVDYGNSLIRKLAVTGIVSLLAGNIDDDQSCSDGGGDGASFTFPEGITTDANGTLFVSDENCGIREVSTGGNVKTFFKNDLENPKPFTVFPVASCVDEEENIYLISLDNGQDPTIYMIDPKGDITRFAGSGASGYKDGDASSAQFSYLQGICIDGQDNIYVTDGSRVREISGGQVKTVAGSGSSGAADGVGQSATFGGLSGICADTKGNLYVTDGEIRMISSGGVVSTVAGTTTSGFKDGPGNTAQFNNPRGICVDAQGNLFVADFGNNRIRKITFTN